MRPTKDEYYLNIAREVARRGSCHRGKIGAIIVKDDVIVATGYVGAPRKTRDCLEREECLRDKLSIPHGRNYELCRSVHAEQNAIINSARAGVSLLEGDMYLWAEDKNGNAANGLPCFICKKMLINAGLKRLIGSTREGSFMIFEIGDWVKNWQDKDILDDEHQYGKE